MIKEPPTYNNDEYLYDIRDGELMRSHPLRPSASQIILYYDGIDVFQPARVLYASKNKLLDVLLHLRKQIQSLDPD